MSAKKNHPSVLITGATGYIGSHLAKRLSKEGFEVHAILRPGSKNIISCNITKHYHDGSTENMVQIVKKANPSVVYHLAAHITSQHNTQNITPLITSNILFGTQLLEAISNLNRKATYLVNTGTYWQNYQRKAYSPVCLYAATKQAFENIIKFYDETTNLKVLTLKLFDTYGANDSRNKLFSIFKKATCKDTPQAMSPGDQLLDLVHIDDVIDAYIAATNYLKNSDSTTHENFLVSSGTALSVKEIAQLYELEVNKPLFLEWGELQYHPRQIMHPWGNGKVLPEWKPKISIIEGIRKLIRENT